MKVPFKKCYWNFSAFSLVLLNILNVEQLVKILKHKRDKGCDITPDINSHHPKRLESNSLIYPPSLRRKFCGWDEFLSDLISHNINLLWDYSTKTVFCYHAIGDALWPLHWYNCQLQNQVHTYSKESNPIQFKRHWTPLRTFEWKQWD